jgi:7-cyano-7-deazaguanine synthase
MMLAVSRHVTKSAVQVMKRHDMAVRSYYGPVNARARAVVLLSGGVDSATAAALTVRVGFDLYALTFSYGQRHQAEVEAARRVAVALGVVRHEVLTFDLRAFGGSALTADLAVPKDRALEEMGRDIPITYVPARNTIFLSFALAWAEVLEAGDIVIGVNRLDYSGYPDCRPEYIEAFERMAALATRAGVEGRQRVRIRTPLIHLTKAEIIRAGASVGVDYSLTLSCYDPAPDGAACGRCDACALRRKGFVDAGVPDPTLYCG